MFYPANLSQTLTARLRRELPKEAFKPQPRRAWIALPLLVVIVSGTLVAASPDSRWYGAVLAGILAGLAYGSLAFLAHETLHGSVFQKTWKQNLIGYAGFWIFGFTPTLWRVWHNQVHHGNTNYPDLDPDHYGTQKYFCRVPLARWQFLTSVGSRHILSLLFFFYRFSYHAQSVLWHFSISRRHRPLFKNLNRRKAIMESSIIGIFWLALGIWFGPRGAFFAILIPWMIANFILMSYISTNHFLRPLTEKNDHLKNSMSVSSPRIVDFIHLNFSHHVEHHFFPSMNWKYTPLIRQKLKEWAADSFLAPPHWKAFLWLMKTPRVYRDAQTLIDPYTGREVDLRMVERELQ